MKYFKDILNKKLQGHRSCPSCKSSDNLAEYLVNDTDLVYYCNTPGCNNYYHTLEMNYQKDTSFDLGSIATKYLSEKALRGLPSDVCNLFNIRYIPNTGQLGFPYYSGGDIDGVKYKTKDKKFTYKGKNKVSLFGLNNLKERNTIVITEGEFDALAVYAVYSGVVDVVSIKNGASSALRDIKAHKEIFYNYDKIVVFFDNDAAGKTAVKQLVDFNPNKVHIVTTNYKDASDIIQDLGLVEGGELIRHLVKTAQSVKYADKQNVLEQAYNLIDAVTEENPVSTGLPSLDQMVGIVPGELVIYASETGMGKSTLMATIAYNVLKQKKKLVFLTFEETRGQVLVRLGNAMSNTYNEYRQNMLTDEEKHRLKKTLSWLNNYQYLEIPKTVNNKTKIVDLVSSVIEQEKPHLLVLDHIDGALSGNINTQDIDNFMYSLNNAVLGSTEISPDYQGCCCYAVSHTSKPDGASKRLVLKDLRGSLAKAQIGHAVVGIYRQERDGHTPTVCYMLKLSRKRGFIKNEFELSFDYRKGIYYEYEQEDATPKEEKFTTIEVGGEDLSQPTRDNDSHQQPRLNPPSPPEDSLPKILHSGFSTEDGIRERDMDRSKAGMDGHISQSQVQSNQEEQSKPGLEVHSNESQSQTNQIINSGEMATKEQVQVGTGSSDTQLLEDGVKPFIALDIETEGLIEDGKIPNIICFSVFNGEKSGVYGYSVLYHLRKFCEEYIPVFHNAAFDKRVIEHHLGIEITEYHDTLLMGAVFNTQQSNSLEDWGERLKVKKLPKPWKGKYPEEFNDDLKEYCQRDTKVTWKLFQAIVPKLKEFGQWDEYLLELRYQQEIIFPMITGGIKLDEEYLNELKLSVGEQVQTLKENLCDYVKNSEDFYTQKVYKREHSDKEPFFFGQDEEDNFIYHIPREINLNATADITTLLLQNGFVISENTPLTKTGKPQITTDSLNQMKITFSENRYFCQLIDEILNYKEVNKLHRDFICRLYERMDNKHYIYPQYNQHSVVSGRLSSNSPNIQQIPARSDLGQEIRKVFIPREGCDFIGLDLSNIELRVLASFAADFCNDDRISQSFKDGTDLHAFNAELWGLYKKYGEEVGTKGKARTLAKTFIYLYVYGGSPARLANTAGIPIEEAENMFVIVDKVYPFLSQMKEKIISMARKNNFITVYGGRRLRPNYTIYRGTKSEKSAAERQIVNMMFQGSAGRILKQLSLEVVDLVNDYKARWVAQIHDEVIIEVDSSLSNELKEEILKVWNSCELLHCPVKSDGGIGKSWAEIH